MPKLIPLTILIPFLTACGALGGAGYRYEHTAADGAYCAITVDSTRIVTDADITIGKNCGMLIEVKKLDANKELAKAVGILASKIPTVP